MLCILCTRKKIDQIEMSTGALLDTKRNYTCVVEYYYKYNFVIIIDIHTFWLHKNICNDIVVMIKRERHNNYTVTLQ